jgi:PKD repeat protein
MKPLNLFRTGTIMVLSLFFFSNAFGQGLSVSEDVKDTNLTREFDKGKGQNPEIVDEGHKPSIFVEPDGTVHMVYFKGIDNLEVKLIYATRKITGDWKYRTLGVAPYCRDNDLVVDNEGNIHVVMADNRWDVSPKSRIFHGILTNTGHWSRKIIAVTGAGFFNLSLKLDSENELYLVCSEFDSPGRMMEMHTEDGVWTKPSYFGEWAYNCIDMDLDKEDKQHISYYSFVIGGLAYRNKPAGGEWSDIEKVEPEWGGGQLEGLVTSITTDSVMDPHISYVGSVNHDNLQHTKYAWKKDGEWHNTLVDRGQFQSGGNKILIDPDGVAHLSYAYFPETYGLRRDVRYATNITGSWVKQTVGSQVDAIDVDMGMDQGKNIHITYGGYTQNYTELVYYNKVQVSRYFNIDPDTLDFTGVLPGQEKVLTLTLTNTLTTDIAIDSITVNDERVSTDKTAFTVARNSVETVKVTFDQTSKVWKDTELNIWFGGSLIAIPVLATNYQPELGISEVPIEFGAVLLGSTVTKTVKLKNNGIMDLNISGITVKYEGWGGYVYPTDFALTGHNCTTLHSGEMCDVQISFNPQKTGSQMSYLNISSNDPTSPAKKVQITGKTAHPNISSSLYDVDFGYCAVGQSVKKTITIRNSGELKLVISDITVSGTDSYQFAMSHNCTELNAGDSCKVQVTMTPALLDDLEATLTITSNAQSSGTLNILLHGTSRVRRLEISPATIDFGEVDLGKKAYALIQFKNSGSGQAVISGIQISGDDQYEFLHSIDCLTIEEGATCTDTVRYIPSFEGMKSATLNVTSNDPFYPVQKVTLAGGTGPALPLHVSITAEPALGVAPQYIDFSAVITGGQGPYWYLWDIENIGRYTEMPAPHILFSKPGFYTIILQLTDINDLTASDTIEVIVSSAGVPIASVSAEPVSGEIPLKVQFNAVVAGGDTPLTYFWNFRDGGTSGLLNPEHTYANTGTYWVKFKVTDANFDSSTDSVLITVKWDNSISGQIWDDDGIFEINESIVRLFPKSDIMSVWTDILEGSNSYEFLYHEPGQYTTLAIPDTTEYPQYLPTYLGRKITLNEAAWIVMDGHITGQDIRLVKKPVDTYGQGQFWGHVGILYYPKKSAVSKGSSEAQDDELAGIYIYLRDAVSGELKAYAITDVNGNFRIKGLENGSYIVIVDYKGLPMDPANPVLEVSDAIKELELKINIFEDKITVNNLTTGIDAGIRSGLRVYPVPAEDHIFLEVYESIFTGKMIRLRLLDLSGRYVFIDKKAELSGYPLNLDISSLKGGVYVLEVSDSKISRMVKIVKMR